MQTFGTMLKLFMILCLMLELAKTDKGVCNNQTKLLIDNDAGGDDAMAIFLALLYEKHFNGPKVVGLTTTHGNTAEEKVCFNNQRILKVAKREDVPIFRGSKKSLVTTARRGDFYGVDGLGDSGEIPKDLVEVQKKTAVDALLELSKTYKGELTVVTLGSLTNVALAVTLDDGFLGRLKHLYVAAGFVKSERFSEAEFNARTDAEAYRIITDAATTDKVTIVPYSTTQLTLDIEMSWRYEVFGAIPTDIVQAQNSYERLSNEKNEHWNTLDPAIVAVAINPELVQEVRRTKNHIDLCGNSRGIVHNEFDSENSNVNLVEAIKKEDYKKFLTEIFSSELTNEKKTNNS